VDFYFFITYFEIGNSLHIMANSLSLYLQLHLFGS